MITIQLTDDELNQVKDLIENTIFEKDVLEDIGLLPKNFNLNIMEFLLIRLKSK
jgi:hypothetical protein